jgi:WXXGXW repeat (2 copies)
MSMRKMLSCLSIVSSAVAMPAVAQIHVIAPAPPGIVVHVAPPMPQVEVIPGPRAGYVWAPGYWQWQGERHVWVSGRHVASRPGHYWVADGWQARDGGHHFSPGRWQPGQHPGNNGNGRGKGNSGK